MCLLQLLVIISCNKKLKLQLVRGLSLASIITLLTLKEWYSPHVTGPNQQRKKEIKKSGSLVACVRFRNLPVDCRKTHFSPTSGLGVCLRESLLFRVRTYIRGFLTTEMGRVFVSPCRIWTGKENNSHSSRNIRTTELYFVHSSERSEIDRSSCVFVFTFNSRPSSKNSFVPIDVASCPSVAAWVEDVGSSKRVTEYAAIRIKSSINPWRYDWFLISLTPNNCRTFCSFRVNAQQTTHLPSFFHFPFVRWVMLHGDLFTRWQVTDVQCYSCGLGLKDTSAVYHHIIIYRWLSNEGIKKFSHSTVYYSFPLSLPPQDSGFVIPCNQGDCTE